MIKTLHCVHLAFGSLELIDISISTLCPIPIVVWVECGHVTQGSCVEAWFLHVTL